MIFVRDIQRIVAEHYALPVSIMCVADGPVVRERRYSRPRQVAMVLATRLTDHSISRIGQFFGGRDHTTVLHAMKAVEKRRRDNPKLHNSLRRLTLELIRAEENTALVSRPRGGE